MSGIVETIEGLTARLRARRRDLGLSQASLAQKMGVTRAAMCQFELAKVNPSLGRYLQWATTLGMELDLRIKQNGNVEMRARG